MKTLMPFALCFILCLGLVGCISSRPEVPRLDTLEGYYDTAITVKVVNLLEGESVYYTLDGSEPSQDSALYSDSGIRLFEGKNHLQAVKIDPKGNRSEILSAIFTISPEMPRLATPDGIYNAQFAAIIVNYKVGDTVFYTLDGSEPDYSSNLYTEDGIPLVEGSNIIKAVKYDKDGNKSKVMTANLIIKPYEPDYSHYFTKFHKLEDTIYYVQSVDNHNKHSAFPEFSKLCGYNLIDGSTDVVLEVNMNRFVIRDNVVYYEYETEVGDGELCYLWCSIDLDGNNHQVLLDSTAEKSNFLNYGFASIMVDEWIYYEYKAGEEESAPWQLYRINTESLTKEPVSSGEGLCPAKVVDRSIIYWGPERKLYRFDVYSGESNRISEDRGYTYKVVDNYIYCYTEEPKKSLFRVCVDGSGKEIIPEVNSSEFVVVGDRIYYGNHGGLHSVRIDGADPQKIWSSSSSNLHYYQGQIFFYSNYSLYCLDLDSDQIKKLYDYTDDQRGYLYFVDGETYYVHNRVTEGDAGLYHLTESGLEKLAGQVE
ncbi:MAG: FN3 associated domain-containing protein [Bacillota bacterium]|jgi:hypothetical protein